MKLKRFIKELKTIQKHLEQSGGNADKDVVIAWPDPTLPPYESEYAKSFYLFRKVLEIGEDNSLDYSEDELLDAVILYPAKWKGE